MGKERRDPTRTLELSSPVMRRTTELYRQRRPTSTFSDRWIDDATWAECVRQARAEIEGEQP